MNEQVSEALEEILNRLHNATVDFAEEGIGNPYEEQEIAKEYIQALIDQQVRVAERRAFDKFNEKTLAGEAEAYKRGYTARGIEELTK